MEVILDVEEEPESQYCAADDDNCEEKNVPKKDKEITPSNELPVECGKLTDKPDELLIEIRDKSFDISGDAGAIGRLKVKERENEIELDIKGTEYTAELVPCATCMLVRWTEDRAKIHSLTNSYVRVKSVVKDVFECGTLKTGRWESDTEDEMMIESQDGRRTFVSQSDATQASQSQSGKKRKPPRTPSSQRKKKKMKQTKLK